MSRLSGEFQTDLPPHDALVACAEAFHELGWPIEKVEANRVLSHNGPASEDPATIEVKLSEPDGGTTIRIIGTDSDTNPLDREELVAVLDQARDAIEACLESAEEGAEEAVEGSAPDQEQEPEPVQPEPPEPAEKDEAPEKAETAPAGWYPDHYDPSQMQYWDGEQWTQEYRRAKAARDEGPTRERAAEEQRAEKYARETETAPSGEVVSLPARHRRHLQRPGMAGRDRRHDRRRGGRGRRR